MIKGLRQIIERRGFGSRLKAQGDEDIQAGVVVAVAQMGRLVGIWPAATFLGNSQGCPALVILAQLRGLKIGQPLHLVVQPRTYQQTGLQAIVQFAAFPPIAQGIGEQTRDHGQRWKVANHAVVVDGLAAKGHQRSLQSHQEMARHFSTPLVR